MTLAHRHTRLTTLSTLAALFGVLSSGGLHAQETPAPAASSAAPIVPVTPAAPIVPVTPAAPAAPAAPVTSTVPAAAAPVSASNPRSWLFALSEDNYGSSAAGGSTRISAYARLYSPLLLGDTLDLTLLGTRRLDTAYARIAYDVPLAHGPTSVGLSYTHLNYTLRDPYTILNAFGAAEIVEAHISRFLFRASDKTLQATAGVEFRQVQDNLGVLGYYNRGTLRTAGISLLYEGRDGLLFGGASSAYLKVAFARFSIGNPDALGFDQIPGGRDMDGTSTRVNLALNRLIPLGKRASFYMGMTGQWASRDLDDSSRMTLGGPQAVRAYSPEEGLVDAGAVATSELRLTVLNNVTASAFFDYGMGRTTIHGVAQQSNGTQIRSGAGVGVSWVIAPKMVTNATVAWRTTHIATDGNTRTPQVYVQLTKVF